MLEISIDIRNSCIRSKQRCKCFVIKEPGITSTRFPEISSDITKSLTRNSSEKVFASEAQKILEISFDSNKKNSHLS